MTALPSGITSSSVVLMPGESGFLTLTANSHAGMEFFVGNAYYPLPQPNVVGSIAMLKAISGAVQSDLWIGFEMSLTNPGFSPAQVNLPVLKIDTGGVNIVDKETDVPGAVTLTSSDSSTSYLPGLAGSDNTATFHVHGNSTALMPKLAYKMKLNTSTDLLTAMGMTCPYVTGSGAGVCDKSKSYILLANYADKAMLRDWAASALALSIPNGGDYLSSPSGSPSPSGASTIMPWAPHSLYVELYLNGQYEGTYQLIEDIKIDSHRVNIKEMDATDISGNALTGGYLMEFDFRQDADASFPTGMTWPIDIDDPDFTPTVPEQFNYISNYVTTAEAVLFSNSYRNTTQGWPAYFDQASAVNFYIVNDLMENWDSGRLAASAYLYKQRNNPLLYFGPVWDFDVSAGNASGWAVMDATIPWMQTQSPWFERFFSDPTFYAAVVQQWNTLKRKGVFDAWISSIQQQASSLELAQSNNFSRWPMFGVPFWVNYGSRESYDEEVAWMVNFIKLRQDYLDSEFNPRPATPVVLSQPTGTLLSDIPVTLTAHVSGASLTGQVSFRSNVSTLARVPVNSSGVATASVLLPPGSDSLDAIYSGDAAIGMSRSNTVVVNVAPPLNQTTTALTPALSGPLEFGSSDIYNVTVTGNAGSSAITGSVSFLVNGTAVQTVALNAAGSATYTDTNLRAGVRSITASYGGDSTHLPSVSPASTITVNKATTVLAWATPAAITYGTLLSGAQLNAVATTEDGEIVAGTFTYEPATGTVLAAGPQVLSATFVPTDTANYSTPPAAITTVLDVHVANTSTAVTSALGSGPSNDSVIFTANVSSPTGAAMGSVVFTDGSTTLDTISLTNGVATYTSPGLVLATHTITASFQANANYNSSSGTVVNTALPFTFLDNGISSLSLTAQLGSPINTTLTLTPSAAFSGTVTFRCTGLPANITCLFTPSSIGIVAGTTAPQSVQLSMNTALAQSNQPANGRGASLALLFGLPGMILAGVGAQRRQKLKARGLLLFAILCLSFAGVTALAGCGGNDSKPAASLTGSYSFHVVATSGSITQDVSAILSIQ
jgi:hypothetical protein